MQREVGKMHWTMEEEILVTCGIIHDYNFNYTRPTKSFMFHNLFLLICLETEKGGVSEQRGSSHELLNRFMFFLNLKILSPQSKSLEFSSFSACTCVRKSFLLL